MSGTAGTADREQDMADTRIKADRGHLVENGTVTRRNGVEINFMIRHVSMPEVPYLSMLVWARSGGQEWTLASVNATAQDARNVVAGWDGH